MLIRTLAASSMLASVWAASMQWTNATLGHKWTAEQLSNTSFPKVEMLARVHWEPANATISNATTNATVNLIALTNATTTASPSTSTFSIFKSTKWRPGHEPTSTKSVIPTTKPAPTSLCMGALDSTAALVDCESDAAAVVWGSHRHLSLSGGCLEVYTKSNITSGTATLNTTATSNSTAVFTSVQDGADVVVGECDPDNSAQLWGLFSTENGVEVRWTPDAPGSDAGDLCLDVVDGVYAEGTPLQVWECQGEGHANQVFDFEALLELNYGWKDPVTVDALALAW